MDYVDADRILKGWELDNILINSEYIKFMLENFSFVLDVSNIQNADSMSIMQIQSILSELNEQYFIFEYTTQDKDTDNLWQIARTFEKIADIDILEINKLPIEYALTIVDTVDCDNISKLENFYKNIAKGNLYKLYNLRKNSDANNSLIYSSDPVRLQIDKLNYQQKIILAIICLNDGKVAIKRFNDLISFISKVFFILPEEIENLNDFIEIQNNYYKLHHSTIIDSMDISLDNFAAVTAYKFLIDYYTERLSLEKQNEEQKEYIFQIIKLYSIFDPIKILDNLNIFKLLITSCVSEMQGDILLKKIFFSLPKGTSNNVKLHIINLGYETGFYKTAYHLLTKFKDDSEMYIILECMLLNRLDKHNENIIKCKKVLRETKHTLRFSLIIKMIKMLSERSLNNFKEYNKTFNQIFQNKAYVKIYEYGFLLRNSQIIFSYKNSLKYIKQSIDFFNLNGSVKNASCSKLTYAVQLARLGFLEESTKILNAIKQILLESTFEKHIVYVNQAAIELLRGTADEKTLLLLEKSFLSVTTSFDKVVVLNNKLCWYILNNVDECLFLSLKAQIDTLLLSEPDLRLHRRTYINYSKYYKNVKNNIIKSNMWLKKAQEIYSNNDELGNVYIFGINKNPELTFLSKQDFYVSFITFWHFDLPMNELN